MTATRVACLACMLSGHSLRTQSRNHRELEPGIHGQMISSGKMILTIVSELLGDLDQI